MRLDAISGNEETIASSNSRIDFQTKGDSDDFSPNLSFTTTVGVIGQLGVRSIWPILSVAWTIGGSIIQDYIVSPEFGVIVPVTDYGANPLVLVWTQPSGATPFNVTADVMLQSPEGPISIELQNTMSVTAPTVTDFASGTNVVAVGVNSAGQTMLQFVLNAANMTGPGIIIDAKVSGTQDADGWIACIQMCTNQRFRQLSNGTEEAWTLNGIQAVDVAQIYNPIYQGVEEPLVSGEIQTIQVQDAPGFEVDSSLTWGAVGAEGGPPEAYATFLMFRPSYGLWVTLQVLNWYWQGEATLSNGTWTLSGAACSTNPVGQASTVLPVWNWNTDSASWQ